MAKDVIAEARFIAPDGSVRIVQYPGTPLRPGNEFYHPLKHDGHLKCMDCEALVHARKAGVSIGGSSMKAPRSTFVAASGHDEGCRSAPASPKSPKQKIDKDKGYLIVLNTAQYSDIFNQATGVYDERGRLVHPDLKNRERKYVMGVEDILQFIRKADPERLKKSKVLFQNNVVDWNQFCIRMGTPSRLVDLFKRARDRKGDTEPPFAMVEIRTTDYFNPSPTRKYPANPKSAMVYPRAPMDTISLLIDGEREKIRLNVYLQEERPGDLRASMTFADSYFVLGEVRYAQDKRDENMHYLNIKVTDARQISRVNIANMANVAMLAAYNREDRMPPGDSPWKHPLRP